VLALALVLGGCASGGPRLEAVDAGRYPVRVELTDTPFFPQRDYQCGPAALATVLAASEAPVTADALVPEVFLPGRQGSLQSELVAATRARDRLPYVLPPRLDALLAQLAAGHPVMVMQKLGAGPWPGWHYAVLVGYDASTERLLLRSGLEPRLGMSIARFVTTWDRAGRWAMVALRPGELPAEPEPLRYLEAAAGLEAVGRLDAAGRAYQAAAREWPTEPLPRLGLANLAYARGELREAERNLRAAIEQAPQDVAARNNRAEVLLQLGCPASARREIESAQALAAGGPHAAAVAAGAARIATVQGPDGPGCPAD
jgi:tetratricopeptide (TPR) repeat protein